MLTPEQIKAVQEYSSKLVENEYKYQQERYPEFWLTITEEQKREHEEKQFESDKEFAEEILTQAGLYKRFCQGTFHPCNKNSRKLFERLYNVKLPPQAGEARKVIRGIIGEEWIRAIEEQRRREEEQKQAEKEAAEFAEFENRVKIVLDKIKNDDMISGDELLDAIHYLKIDVPIRTKGAINRISLINSYKSQYYPTKSKNPLPSSCYRVYRQIKESLEVDSVVKA